MKTGKTTASQVGQGSNTVKSSTLILMIKEVSNYNDNNRGR